MTFTVSSFDLSHGSQIKVATKLSLLYSVLKHAAVLLRWEEQAEDSVFMYSNLFASGLPPCAVQC